MGYKLPSDRRAYINAYRAKRQAEGYWGRCKHCDKGLCHSAKTAANPGVCRDCMKGELSPFWSGGYKNSDGYIVVTKGKLQHRIVMESILGRTLYDDETVHHRNGVRDDNRPENLELWVGAPVRGIKVEDAVAWAREILRRYDDEL